MRRHLVLVLALALAGSLGMGEPTTDEAVLATDRCAEGPSVDEVMLDAHDLCDVTVRVTTGDDVTPRVGVTLRTAEAPAPGSVYVGAWSTGDCYFELRHEAPVIGVDGAAEDLSRLWVGCGEYTRICLLSAEVADAEQEVDCRHSYADALQVEIPAPNVDGKTLTLEVTFDGELAHFAPLFRPGAAIQQRLAIAAPDIPWFTSGPTPAVIYCGSIGCTELGGDVVLGGGSLTISG